VHLPKKSAARSRVKPAAEAITRSVELQSDTEVSHAEPAVRIHLPPARSLRTIGPSAVDCADFIPQLRVPRNGQRGASPSAYTLCHTDETVVFSCATGTHFLSICASPNLSKEAGYLQYRYGSKDKLELVYPTTPQPPTGLFVPFEQTYSGALVHLYNSRITTTPIRCSMRSVNGGRAALPPKSGRRPVWWKLKVSQSKIMEKKSRTLPAARMRIL
jgi:hypothetical protein